MKKFVSIIAVVAVSCSIAACARTNRQGAQNNTNQYTADQTGINPGTTTGLDQTGVNPYNVNQNLTPNDNLMGNRAGYNTGTQAGMPGYNNTGTAQGVTPAPNYTDGTVQENKQNTAQITDENYNGGGLGNSQVNLGRAQGNQNNQGNAQGYATGMYNDGTFTADGDRNTRATVTISGGRITDIVLARTDANGTVTQDENLNLGNQPGGGATSNVGQTTRSIANAMIQAQSPDIVTSTTGDTTIVDDMKLAVRRALDKARK